MILNRASWAKKHEVSRAAVTLAVDSGALVANADGNLDEDHPKNVAWVQRRVEAARRKAAKLEKKATPKPAPAPKTQAPKPARKAAPKKPATENPVDQPAGDTAALANAGGDLPDAEVDKSEDMGLLSVQKLRAEIKFKREAAEAHRVKRLRYLGTLVEREQVRQVLGRFNAELRVRLLEMPGTVAPRLAAMARSGAGDVELAGLLEDEIALAIESAKGLLTRADMVAAR